MVWRSDCPKDYDPEAHLSVALDRLSNSSVVCVHITRRILSAKKYLCSLGYLAMICAQLQPSLHIWPFVGGDQAPFSVLGTTIERAPGEACPGGAESQGV